MNKFKIKKIPKTNLDYVELYAENLKLFEQQKMLIESQLFSSNQLAKKRFGTKNFKINAREHLKKIGLL